MNTRPVTDTEIASAIRHVLPDPGDAIIAHGLGDFLLFTRTLLSQRP